MSGLHALTIAISAYWSLFYSCGGDKTAFNNTQCQNYPRNIHILNVLFTSSFMLFQTIILLVFVRGNTVMDYQTYFHHISGFLCFYAALTILQFPVMFGNMMLLMEASGPFVNLRWLLFNHDVLNDNIVHAINTVGILVTFIVLRFFFQWYCVLVLAAPWMHENVFSSWFNSSTSQFTAGQQVLLVLFAVAVVANCALNMFWLALILKQVKRAVKRLLGVASDEDLKDVQADLTGNKEQVHISNQEQPADIELIKQNQPRSDQEVV